MACDLATVLSNACTSGIGKLTSKVSLLQAWAELSCEYTPVPPCTSAPSAPLMDLPDFASPGNYTLNWSAPAQATSYLLDLAEDAAFTVQILSDEPIATNSAPIADVTGATRYSRVRAVNACGTSDYSNVIMFSTDGTVLLAYDTFESYTADADLDALNGGTNWAAGYASRSSLFITKDTLETYTAGSDLDGLNAGSNWDAAYVSRSVLVITVDTLESYSAADPLDGLNGGSNWNAAYASRP